LGFIIGNLLVLLHFEKLLAHKAEIYLTFRDEVQIVLFEDPAHSMQ
jgi:hypothetical protein